MLLEGVGTQISKISAGGQMRVADKSKGFFDKCLIKSSVFLDRYLDCYLSEELTSRICLNYYLGIVVSITHKLTLRLWQVIIQILM